MCYIRDEGNAHGAGLSSPVEPMARIAFEFCKLRVNEEREEMIDCEQICS